MSINISVQHADKEVFVHKTRTDLRDS